MDTRSLWRSRHAVQAELMISLVGRRARWIVAGWESHRKSRFHTLRGELLPLGALLDIPGSAVRRLLGQDGGPWMTPAAVRYLSELIRPETAILELGSGLSTIWYASRCRTITSLEDDPSWFGSTVGLIENAGLRNCHIELLSLGEFPDRLRRFDARSFDLVVIDCNETDNMNRIVALKRSAYLVRPGGHLVLDDSDRAEYRSADDELRDWPRARFLGVKAVPLCATETTVYRRPGSLGSQL